MKIQSKIALLLSAITLLFISGLIYINDQETKREEFFLKSKIHEKNTLFDKVMRLEGATLEMFTFDYSNSDRLINIIRNNDKSGFSPYFRDALRSFNVNSAWIYSKDFKLLHTITNIDDYHPYDINHGDDFTHKIASRGFYHFFKDTPAGLMEIRCAPVQPSADMQRSLPPEGYLFAGRLWSESFLSEVSVLTESNVTLLPVTDQKKIDAKYDPARGIISFSRVVQTWDAKPLNIINVESITAVAKEMYRASTNQIILIICFVMFIVLLLTALLILWVNIPMKKISRSLDTENPSMLFSLKESKSEFGKLAQLIIRFFNQQHELINSEERFRSVVQTASDAIISVDKNNSIVFWNRASETLFGYTPEEAIGRNAGILLPERFASMYQNRVNQITSAGIPGFDRIPVELVGLGKDGSEFPMEFSQSTWKTDEGVFYTAIIRDISQRKNAEEDIIKSEKRFRDIVENSLSGILIVHDKKVVYHNEEIARLFGSLPEQFDYLNVANIYPDDREQFQTFFRLLLSNSSPVADFDFRFYPFNKKEKYGELKWVNCRGSIIDYQGKESVFLNIMDISRIMELEKLLRIQDKMASLGRVAAGIAHEIRNPLTGINSYLYAIKKISVEFSGTSDSPQLESYISGIQSASDKIESVIRRVMDFSKPTNPKLCLVDINKSIEDALLLSSATLRKNSINLTKSLSSELPACHADSHMIEQVILNLLTNSVQAMSKTKCEKKIEISTSVNSNKIHITVSDSGPGIPEEHRFKIFDPFYTTKTDSMGIGLGLCQRIIADHGGQLSVSRSRFGGAEFCVELPRLEGK